MKIYLETRDSFPCQGTGKENLQNTYFRFTSTKTPILAYQIYQTLQIYLVYEKDDIKYKYDRKWKTENMAEKHIFQE